MGIWDTSMLPETEQFEYFHQVICRAFVPLLPIPSGEVRGFASTVETRPLGDLVRAEVASLPQATHHGPAEVSATTEAAYFVNLQLEGHCHVRQGPNESFVVPGQFTVLDTTRPFYLDAGQNWRMLSFRIPHERFDGRLRGRGLPLGTVLGPSGAGSVAAGLTRMLWSMQDELPAHTAQDLVQSFSYAVAAALTAKPFDAGEMRAETTRALVTRYLLEHLGDASLSVVSVSRAFAVSPRTLHALFSDEDESFAATMRRMRMRRAADLLTDPSRSVTAVGGAVGYPDPNSFGRAFRRFFGESPRAYRQTVHQMPSKPARMA